MLFISYNIFPRFIFESAIFDHEVVAALLSMKRSSEVRQNAINWFENRLKMERQKVWRSLMTDKNIDLSSAMPYLIRLSKTDTVWQTLDSRGKDYVFEWQRRVNFTILEMFILRHKA